MFGAPLLTIVSLAIALASDASAVALRGNAVLDVRAFGAAMAPRATTALDSFCSDFKTACNEVCLSGKTGMTKIVVACSQNDDGSFGFGCTCDGTSSTAAALKRVTKPLPVTISLTSADLTTVTKTLTSTSISKDGTSTVGLTLTTKAAAPRVSTKTSTVFGDTTRVGITKTTTIHTTHTESYVPRILTTETPGTSTQTSYDPFFTSTYSTLDYNVEERSMMDEMLEVSLSNAKRATTFCNTFFTACDDACDAEGSSTKTSTCDKTASATKQDTYTLLCMCKNKKSRTTKALAGVVSDDQITKSTTVLTTKTSTAQTTQIVTSVRPATTVTATERKTVTTGSAASTKIVTATATKTIATGATRLATDYDFSFVTKTIPSTTTTVTYTLETPVTTLTTSTTYNILAPTGVVRFDTSQDEGGVYAVFNGGVMSYTSDASSAQTWALMRQSAEGVTPASYALMDVGAGRDGRFFEGTPNDGPYYDGGCQTVSVCDFVPDDYFTKTYFTLGEQRDNSFNPSSVWEAPLTFEDITLDGVTYSPAAIETNDGYAGVQIGDSCTGTPLQAVFEPRY